MTSRTVVPFSTNNTNSSSNSGYSSNTSSNSKTTMKKEESEDEFGTAFDNRAMVQSQGLIVGMNALGYVISLGTPTHYHVDLLGTSAFAVSALPSLLWSLRGLKMSRQEGCSAEIRHRRVFWSSLAVIAWSSKLALYLFYRVIGHGGQDSRLSTVLSTPRSAASFWFVSAVWGVLCSLPHSLGTTSTLAGSDICTNAGLALFGLGFSIETIADYQKFMFRRTAPLNQFCNVGLWSLSQHPNWFGNLLLWSGIFVMNAPALVEPSTGSLLRQWWRRYRRIALAALGPTFLYGLFYTQATGTLLEQSFYANRSKYGYGKDPNYTNYVETTPLFIPWFSMNKRDRRNQDDC